MAYIYKITNDINGKVYIGKTEHSIEKRFKEHCRDRLKRQCEKRPLYSAMNKYGIEHFHIELIESTDNPNEREAFWIEKFNSYHNGYNATKGGDGKSYLNYDLIRNTYFELKNATDVAKKLNISTDSVRIAVRQVGKLRSGGQISKEKTSKPVVMINKDTKCPIRSFNSLKDAAKFLVNSGVIKEQPLDGMTCHIRACAHGHRKIAYGYMWVWAQKTH